MPFGRLKNPAALLTCLLALLVSLSQLARAADAPARIPIEDFFQYATFSDATLSPDGKNIALKVSNKDTTVMPVDTQVPRVIVRTRSDVDTYRWVNNTRLVYTLTDRTVPPGEVDMTPGLFAVDIDGKGDRQLASRRDYFFTDGSQRQKMMSMYTTLLTSVGKQDSEKIYVNSIDYEVSRGAIVDLVRLNTFSGRAETIRRPGPTTGWLLDQNSEPRIAITEEKGVAALYYKEPESDEWQKLQDFSTKGRDRIDPLAFGPDGTLYVASRNGSDTAALYRYDIKARKLAAQPMVDLKGYDLRCKLVFRNGKLAGLHFVTDASSTIWFDDELKKIQKVIDDKMPYSANHLSFGSRSETPYMLVRSYSDVEPGATWLFNTATQTLRLLGRAHPQIDSAQMSTMEAVSYKARDGLTIPAFLTLPHGGPKTGLPLIVLAHGGPWVNAQSWGWNPEVQFLASRGYAVLEPQFRGTLGYGEKFFLASFRQWGLAMQDDLADGAKWMIASGVVDPKRICIAGASYGGYAALMGVMKDPDLFRCAVDWVGVTDINLLFTARWSDATESVKTYTMPTRVGDPVKYADYHKSVSPLVNAAKITQPLLMAYGTDDHRVPLVHGDEFYAAVKVHNKDVEYIKYPGEGHGWTLVPTRLDFWQRVEKFLDRQIGGATGGAGQGKGER